MHSDALSREDRQGLRKYEVRYVFERGIKVDEGAFPEACEHPACKHHPTTATIPTQLSYSHPYSREQQEKEVDEERVFEKLSKEGLAQQEEFKEKQS